MGSDRRHDEPTITEQQATRLGEILSEHLHAGGPFRVRLVAPNVLQTQREDGTELGKPRHAPQFVEVFLRGAIRASGPRSAEHYAAMREDIYAWIRSVEGEVSA